MADFYVFIPREGVYGQLVYVASAVDAGDASKQAAAGVDWNSPDTGRVFVASTSTAVTDLEGTP